MSQRVAIVGIGQTYHRTRRPDVNEVELVNEAVRAALDDAQITMKDVDAVLLGNMELFEGHFLMDAMAADGSGAYMKQGLKLNTGGTIGGTMGISAFHHVASGLFDTVLTIGFEKHDVAPALTALASVNEAIYDRVFSAGTLGPFATIAQAYMQRSGCQPEHAAMVRVKAANNAIKNPYAHVKQKITVQDVLNSRQLAGPLRLMHLCPQSCGACALVMTNESKAKKLTSKPVWVRDTSIAHEYGSRSSSTLPDPFPFTRSQTVAAQKLYKRNGITNPFKQLDVFEMYEPSSWVEIMWMEDFLLAEKNQAWKLIERGATEIEGELPINPSGGVVCTNPIGATGLVRVAEAALQVRGDAGEHQVRRDVKLAVATAFGGTNWTTMMLLGKTLN